MKVLLVARRIRIQVQGEGAGMRGHQHNDSERSPSAAWAFTHEGPSGNPCLSPRIAGSRPGGIVAASSDEVRNFAWYHTLELPGGVVTPGMFDTRPAAAKIPMPSSLA